MIMLGHGYTKSKNYHNVEANFYVQKFDNKISKTANENSQQSNFLSTEASFFIVSKVSIFWKS